MTYVAYLSHPIGPPDQDHDTYHRDNIDNAGQWLQFLVAHTTWAIMCPWLGYCNAMGSVGVYGPRALTDQIMLLERCDFIVRVGGSVSPHMQIEANHARRREIPMIDLTDLGARPEEEEHVLRQLRLRMGVVETAHKRRVWMPPLSDNDVEALRAAQVVLHHDPFSADAKIVIQRIITAATLRPKKKTAE